MFSFLSLRESLRETKRHSTSLGIKTTRLDHEPLMIAGGSRRRKPSNY